MQAREDVRTGKVDAAVVIPAQYSRRVYAQDAPELGLVVDNSDQFTSGSLEAEMQSLVTALTTPVIQPRLANSIALEIVELYPYVNYMKFLLPLTIALAMYISVMIGGGMLYIDDKARGVHEGYLVTPITKFELVFGMNIAGSMKAVLAGICITVIGSLMAGLGVIFHPVALVELLLPDRRILHRLQRHDVSHDGARRRSTRAPRHVRRPQHPAPLSLWRHVSHRRLSPLASSHLRH